MSRLKDILLGIDFELIQGSIEQEVTALHFDSRKASEESVFFAVPGVFVDGHDYINSAIDQGCRIIICERKVALNNEEVTCIIVKDTSAALALISGAFSGYPSSKLKLVGITGTNGKTTTATLLHDLYSDLGYTCGLISTVVNKVGNREIQSTHTTPNSVSLNLLLVEMVEAEGGRN